MVDRMIDRIFGAFMHPVYGLLSECLEWSGEVPFQRLEYLGDAG